MATIFLFLYENICCGYSLGALHRHMLWVFIKSASLTYVVGIHYKRLNPMTYVFTEKLDMF